MKIYLETHGCTSNQADSEILLGALSGHKIVKKPEEADLCILNTCTVKAATERKMLARIKELSSKALVVAGCLPQVTPDLVRKTAPNASLLGLVPSKISEVVKQTYSGKQVEVFGRSGPRVCVPKQRLSQVIARIPVAQGCLGNCSYCIARLARGELKSAPVEKIIREIQQSLNSGFKELWITSQDNSVYGKDIGTSLPQLLGEISQLTGEFRVRIGMMNPGTTLQIIDEIIENWDPRFFRFFHLPVQSGDDQILRDMNRKYSANDFIELAKILRKKFLDLCLSTDVICGYPTEAEDQWLNTIKLVKKTRPNIINISRFEPRPGTAAAQLKPLAGRVTKARSREMAELSARITLENLKKFVGTKQTVLIDEPRQGRTDGYRPVAIRGKLGTFTKVKIKEAHHCYLS